MEKNSLEDGQELQLDFTKLKSVAELHLHVIPVVVQDSCTKEVLIVAYINDVALQHSIETGYATFWSTSRNELWEKGKTSEDRLRLDEIRVNCEQNSLLFLVSPAGVGACHTKNENGVSRPSCYYRRLEGDGRLVFVA
jgi:phosphoribosyl-AMP cyclohydrolase